MPLQFRPLTVHIGAEVEGLDLREPLSDRLDRWQRLSDAVRELWRI